MLHSFDSYGLYKISKFSTYIIRTKVIMKDAVDIAHLRKAVNVATRRYPYFMVKVAIDKDGGYDFIPNSNDIVVLNTSKKNPKLGSKEVGYHLLYVDCEGDTIYFNSSHSFAGGKGITPWIMSCVYQYVVEKYGVEPEAPFIRKADSELLEGETAAPTLEMTKGSEKYSLERFRGAKSLIKDYLNSFFNPFLSSNEYYELEFGQSEILKYAKDTNNSVLSLFVNLMYKAMLKVYPDEEKITCEVAHNPSVDLGIPNSYTNVLSHVHFCFTKDMENWEMEKLGATARNEIKIQVDPLYSRHEIGQYIYYYEGIDSVSGYKEKLKYAKEHDLVFKNDAVHGTFLLNYTGYLDWGKLSDYMKGYYHIVDGHQMLELSAMGDKIFCCFLQVIRTKKYINAFTKVLEEFNISYKINGPFKKNLMTHHVN